jgi:hypothetical protein
MSSKLKRYIDREISRSIAKRTTRRKVRDGASDAALRLVLNLYYVADKIKGFMTNKALAPLVEKIKSLAKRVTKDNLKSTIGRIIAHLFGIKVKEPNPDVVKYAEAHIKKLEQALKQLQEFKEVRKGLDDPSRWGEVLRAKAVSSLSKVGRFFESLKSLIPTNILTPVAAKSLSNSFNSVTSIMNTNAGAAELDMYIKNGLPEKVNKVIATIDRFISKPILFSDRPKECVAALSEIKNKILTELPL